MSRNRQSFRFGGIAVALAILLAGASLAQATTFYWQYVGPATWTQAVYPMGMTGWYSNQNPAAGDTAYVGYNGTLTTSGANAVNTMYIAQEITVTTGLGTIGPANGTVVVNSGQSLTVGSTLYLGGTSHTGTLNINGTLVLGTGGLQLGGSAANATLNMGGGTLQANSSFAFTPNVGLTGTGTTSTINTQSYNLAFSGNFTDSGGGNGLAKIGPGTLTLSGANTYTGATTVKGGTLALDYATNGSVLSSSSALALQSGGTLQMLGNNSGATSQTVNGLTVGAGGGGIVLNPRSGTSTTLNLGTITASAVGGSLLVNAPTNTTVTTSTLDGFGSPQVGGNGIYGGRIVFTPDGVNYDWATTTSGSGPYTISANGTYVDLAASVASTDNARIQTAETLGAAPQTVNTLKIEGATGLDLNTQTLTINGGGLLVTGSNPVTISDGNLTAGSAGIGGVNNELIIQQYNTGSLTISAPIIDNGGATSLTKAGPGTTTLSGTNLYSGTTTVAAGTLQAATTASLPRYGTAGKMAVANGATLQINYGGGSDWTAANVASLLTANGANFASGSALGFDTTNASSGGTYTTAITGGIGVTKVGNNALYMGFGNTYTGNTNLDAGILSVERTSSGNGLSVLGTGGTLYLNGGSLSAWYEYVFRGTVYAPYVANAYQINQSVGFGDTTFGGTASLVLSGPGTINTANPTITVSTPTGQSVTLGGLLTDNGNGFTKAGPGKLILGGITTSPTVFTGPIVINNGTVQFGSSNSGGNYTVGTPSTVTVNSGGFVSVGTYNALYQSNVVLNGTGAFVAGASSGHGMDLGSLASSGSTTPIALGSGFGQYNYSVGVGLTNQNTTFDGTFTDASPNNANVVKVGTGSWTLTGQSSQVGNQGDPAVNTTYGCYSPSGWLVGMPTSGNVSMVAENGTLVAGASSTGTYGVGGFTSPFGASALLVAGNLNNDGTAITLTSNTAVNIGNAVILSGGAAAMTSGTINGTVTLGDTNNNAMNLSGPVTIAGIAGNGGLTGSNLGVTPIALTIVTPGTGVTISGNIGECNFVSAGGYGFSAGTYSSVGSSIIKAGAGTLTLSGNNSYTGGTMLNSGQLNINSPTALGDPGTFTINGGTIDCTQSGGVVLTNNNPQAWNGDVYFVGSNSLDMGTGAVAMNGNTQVTVGANTLSIGGAISNAIGSGLAKAGGGTLVLYGANTYTGMTTVNAGTLAYGANNVIAGAVTVNAGEFALGAYSGTVTGVTLTGGLISSTSSGTLTSTSDFNVQNGSITANLAGTVGLTKTTSGTVVLGSLSGYTPSGSLTYTGLTTINGGTLEAIGAGGLGLLTSAGLNIEHGAAVLDFTGLIDPPTLDPIANTLMQQARANGWVIDGTHPVGSTTAAANPLIDALGWTDTVVGGRTVLTVMYTLCGDANLDGVVNGADLNVVLSNYNKTGMYWSEGDFNYDGTVNGADLNEVLSNYNQSVSVGAAVPEPSTLLLAVAGLAGLLAYAWRKRK